MTTDELVCKPIEKATESELQWIDTDSIAIYKNTRIDSCEKHQLELTDSIRENGILQPITLTSELTINQNEVVDQVIAMVLIAGHRRLLAAKALGLQKVPAIVRGPMNEEYFTLLQLIENLQREDITPWDEADRFCELSKKMYVKDIAQLAGKSQLYVAERIALASITVFWKEKLQKGWLTVDVALAIAKLPHSSQHILEDRFNKSLIREQSDIIRNINALLTNLSEARFPTAQVICEGKPSCMQCSKRTGNNLLFIEITKDDICLDKPCFQENTVKYAEFLFEEKRKLVPELIAVNYGNFDIPSVCNAIGWSKYQLTDEASGMPAMYVAGDDIGRIIHIKLREDKLAKATQVDPSEALRQKKLQNKIEHQARLIAKELSDESLSMENQSFLDYVIAENILSMITSDGKMDELVKYLIKEHSWTDETLPFRQRADWCRRNLASYNTELQKAVSRKINLMTKVFSWKKHFKDDIFDLLQYCTQMDHTTVLEMAKERIEQAKSKNVDTKNKKAETNQEVAKDTEPDKESEPIEITQVLDKDFVISKCRIVGHVVMLPAIDLERKLYDEVAKALKGIGGKWNRKEKGFVFSSDPTALLGRVQEGEKINIQKEFQYFPTPPELALKMVELADINEDDVILEPSAGQGALLNLITGYIHKEVDSCELMEENATILRQKEYNVVASDFLTYNPEKRYTKIIANPPFASNQDIDHVLHMYELLSPGGMIVTIMSTHFTFSKNKKETQFRKWLKTVEHTLEEIESGAFQKSGTMVKTCLVTITKPEKTLPEEEESTQKHDKILC